MKRQLLTRVVAAVLIGIASSVVATPSPAPQDVMPVDFEFGMPSVLGNTRGYYKGLKFGQLLFDSGSNAMEEMGFGEVRHWVFQAAGGTVTVGSFSYAATCIRARRINVLTPSEEFYYELSVSALEGSCTEKADNRLIEMAFQMGDFVVMKYREGTGKYYGQTSKLMLYPTPLRAPESFDAVLVDGAYFLGSKLAEVPFVAGLRVELMLRPKGEMSCNKSKFNPDKDPYSSFSVVPDSFGKWGTTVPKLGGAVCMRLSGGGWNSAVSLTRLP